MYVFYENNMMAD